MGSLLNIFHAYWFWLITAFGVSSVLFVRNCMKNGINFPLAVTIAVVSFYGGIWGTRILSLLVVNPSLFWLDPALSLAFWQGGMSWQGSLPFSSLTLFVVTGIARKPFWPTLGCAGPAMGLSLAIGRIGCLNAGCCYGSPTDVPWAIYSGRLNTMVHPTQVYSMVAELCIFALLQWVFEKKPSFRKYLFLWYVMLHTFQRFFQEFFRGAPPGPELISGLRIYQVTSITLFVLASCIFLVMIGRKWSRITAAILPASFMALFVIF